MQPKAEEEEEQGRAYTFVSTEDFLERFLEEKAEKEGGGGGSFFVPTPPPPLQRRASWQMAVQEKDRKADHQHTTAAAATLEDKADTWLNAPKAQSRVKVRI